MCRSIKTLHNFKPPATDGEIRASSLQFIRKLSGFSRPSKANEIAFNRAVDEWIALCMSCSMPLSRTHRHAIAKPKP